MLIRNALAIAACDQPVRATDAQSIMMLELHKGCLPPCPTGPEHESSVYSCYMLWRA